jgi:hypothetical protein
LAERDHGERRPNWSAISAEAQRNGKTIIGEPPIIKYHQRWICEAEPEPCIIDRWARGVVPVQNGARKEFLPPTTAAGTNLPPVTTASMIAGAVANGAPLGGTSSDFPVIYSTTASSPGPLARSMTFGGASSSAHPSTMISTLMSATTQSLPPATSLINQTSSGLCEGVAFPSGSGDEDDNDNETPRPSTAPLQPLPPADSSAFWSKVGMDSTGRPTLPLPIPPPDIDTRPRAMKPSRTNLRTTMNATSSTRDLPAATALLDQKAANAAVEIVDIVKEKTEEEEEADRMREVELRKMEKKRKAKQKAGKLFFFPSSFHLRLRIFLCWIIPK